MKRVGINAAIVYCACLITLFVNAGGSLAMAEEFPNLTAEQAIIAARHNAKPGSSFTILWKIIANADTRRTGDQAFEQAQARKSELYKDGLLVDILRSSGYVLAETSARTNNIVSIHIAFMEISGTVRDISSECHGVVKLADVDELVKDTAKLVQQLYSTPSTEGSSLASRFYDGKFPNADDQPDSLFAIPTFLQKTSSSPDEVRKAAALFWGYAFWTARYALSMPIYAANPAVAENAAENKRDALKVEFLQRNNMNLNFDPTDFDNIQDEKQLRKRIEVLTRLDSFLEEAFLKVADPAIIRTNLAILMMPLSIDVVPNQTDQYLSSSPPKSLFLWQRVATGGFGVKEITWAW